MRRGEISRVAGAGRLGLGDALRADEVSRSAITGRVGTGKVLILALEAERSSMESCNTFPDDVLRGVMLFDDVLRLTVCPEGSLEDENEEESDVEEADAIESESETSGEVGRENWPDRVTPIPFAPMMEVEPNEVTDTEEARSSESLREALFLEIVFEELSSIMLPALNRLLLVSLSFFLSFGVFGSEVLFPSFPSFGSFGSFPSLPSLPSFPTV